MEGFITNILYILIMKIVTMINLTKMVNTMKFCSHITQTDYPIPKPNQDIKLYTICQGNI